VKTCIPDETSPLLQPLGCSTLLDWGISPNMAPVGE